MTVFTGQLFVNSISSSLMTRPRGPEPEPHALERILPEENTYSGIRMAEKRAV